jgi:ribonuclease P protein subunit RPR2
MVRKHKQKPAEFQKIASERIQVLFDQAKKNFHLDSDLSDRYVYLARKIAMRYKLKIKSQYKRRYCKHCYSYFMPSKTCRVRTKEGKLIYFCFSCKKFSRFIYK